MQSKRIGNIGEAKVLSELTKYGIPVLLPFGDNEAYDLVIEINNEFKKIQVKTSEKIINGKVSFSIVSSKKETYDNKVDYLALYNIEKDIVLFIPTEETNNCKIISFRFDKPKNNQTKFVRYIENYSLEKILFKK